jgi:hypothetical protein
VAGSTEVSTGIGPWTFTTDESRSLPQKTLITVVAVGLLCVAYRILF